MATHNVQTNCRQMMKKQKMRRKKKHKIGFARSLRIERENFSSHEIRLLYRLHVCDEIRLPHHTITITRLPTISWSNLPIGTIFTLTLRVGPGLASLGVVAHTRKYNVDGERWANETPKWTLINSMQWNVKYGASNLWLAYRIERHNNSESSETRTDNLSEAAAAWAVCRVHCVIYFFVLVPKWIVADEICNKDQCWTIIKSHHQKVAQLFIYYCYCCCGCCYYPSPSYVFLTMRISMFDVFGRSHRSHIVDCLLILFVACYCCCRRSFLWTHTHSSGYGSTACQGSAKIREEILSTCMDGFRVTYFQSDLLFSDLIRKHLSCIYFRVLLDGSKSHISAMSLNENYQKQNWEKKSR